MIGETKKVLTDQIERLEISLRKLKDEFSQKEDRIRELTDQTGRDEKDLLYFREAKESLEQKIATYNDIIQRLLRRRERADVAFDAFYSKALNVSDLDKELSEEIQKRIGEIDATSFKGYAKLSRESARGAFARSETRASLEMKAKRHELEEAEQKQKAQAAAKLTAPLPSTAEPFGVAPVSVTRKRQAPKERS
jgi:DNA repair exonuclease SbcCD ATPase subunit